MSEPIWYSVVDLSTNPGLSEALTLCPYPAFIGIVWEHVTPDLIVLNTFTVEGKHEGPVLGIWPLSFPNISSPWFSVEKLTFLPGAT